DRYVLLAEAKEAADTNNNRLDVSFRVDDDVGDITNMLGVVGRAVVDVLADDLRGKMAVSLHGSRCSFLRHRSGRVRGGGRSRGGCFLRIGTGSKQSGQSRGGKQSADHVRFSSCVVSVKDLMHRRAGLTRRWGGPV